MSHQFSIVGGVGSGAGALGLHGSTDQTGNLLGIDAMVITPNVMINRMDHPGGVKKKRFGGVSKMSGAEFNYPQHPVKTAGGENGQAYQASKAGYLPGNGGGGNAGVGLDRFFGDTKVQADLTEAQRVAFRESELFMKFGGAEHIRTVDRSAETLREHFEEQAAEHEREKIAHLMSMGFSEEEIHKKAVKDREKAIEQAQKMAPKASAGLMSKAMPTSDKFFNDDVQPGLVPARKDWTSYERAVAAGTPVAQAKARQAMRMKEKMGLRVDRQEKVEAKLPMAHSDIVQKMMSLAAKEKSELDHLPIRREEEMIKHQKMKDTLVNAKLAAMDKAMK